MENSILTTIRWQNADVYHPDQYKEAIIYCNDENKINVLDNTITGCSMDDNWKITYYSDWEKLKNFYHIKWWAYHYNITPDHK